MITDSFKFQINKWKKTILKFYIHWILFYNVALLLFGLVIAGKLLKHIIGSVVLETEAIIT